MYKIREMLVLTHAHQLKHLGLTHRYQAKKIQLPPERDFVLICNKKAHFLVLGLTCFLKLMGIIDKFF